MIESLMVAMSDPMSLWYVIVGALLAVLVFGSLRHSRKTHVRGTRKVHVFDIARERELFYIPGDARYDDRDDDTDDF